MFNFIVSLLVNPFILICLIAVSYVSYLIYRHLKRGVLSLLSDYVKLPGFDREIFIMLDMVFFLVLLFLMHTRIPTWGLVSP